MTVILFTIGLVAVFWHARQRGAEFTARKIMWVWVLCGATLAVSALASELGFSLFSLILPIVCLALVWGALMAGGISHEHLRGGVLVDARTLEKLAKKEDPGAEVFIGGVGVPRALENRHFLLAGVPGSGKSQTFYAIGAVARQRGDAAVVADVNAEMLGRFYDPERGDAILNPIDTRSESWSPLAEISGEWDCDRLAKSIIPPADGAEGEWKHFAQVLLSAVLSKVYRENGKNFDLANLLLSASAEELGETLKGTQAALFFAAGSEKMLSSIRSVLMTHCQPFSYLKPDAGRDAFSITKFVQREAREKRGAWLYFPVRDDFFNSFRPLIAGQIDIAISALLSADDDEARRVWFMLDEFASWGRIAGIGDFLTKARKKGGVGALGLQTISQVRQSWGRDGAQTLLACLGTWLTLRCGDSETSEFMSQNIGDEQVRRYVESTNHERQKSSAEQIAVERAIMPADLKNLPDLVGILNIAGPLPAGWVHIPISPLKRTVPSFKIGNDPTPAVADSALTAALPESALAAPDFVGELLDIGDDPTLTEAAK